MTRQEQWEKKVDLVLRDPATSWWLKGCLAGAVRKPCPGGYTARDPVDVQNELEVLNELLTDWFALTEVEAEAL